MPLTQSDRERESGRQSAMFFFFWKVKHSRRTLPSLSLPSWLLLTRAYRWQRLILPSALLFQSINTNTTIEKKKKLSSIACGRASAATTT